MTTKQKEAVCQHRWYIGTSLGKTSQGKCVKCGEVREFQNTIENSWGTNKVFKETMEEKLGHTLSYYRGGK